MAADPVAVPAEVAVKAGTTIIESGVLGALLIVSVLANVALVYVLIRLQNKRVEDMRKNAEVAEKMVTAFSSVNGTLDGLDENNKVQAAALQALSTTMQTILLTMLNRPGMLAGPQQSQGHNNPTGGTG